eukprot:scaffold68671_cov56-Cyclotella_meneghiniana.AAC.1
MKIISIALATFLRPHLSRAFVTANSSSQTRTVLKMSTVTSNPLLNSKELPKFSSISPSDLTPAIESILSQLESDFSSLESTLSTASPDYEAVLPEVEKIQHPLNYAWGIAGHLKGVKDSEELRKAYEENQANVVKASMKFGQSRVLYEALKKVDDAWTGEEDFEMQQKKRAVANSLREMTLAGVGFEEGTPERVRFNEIKLRFAELSTAFSNNVLDATKAFGLVVTKVEDVEGVPASALGMASDLSVKECEAEDKKEEEGALGKNNVVIINEILKLRKEMAGLLGFENFAELSLSKKMAPSVESVHELSNLIRDKALPAAEKELAKATALAREAGGKEYSESSLPKLMPFFLDPYSRPADKRGGAWMADCIGKSASLGFDIPVAYLTCNGSPPVGDKPSLMTFCEVETLFHEFGHGLQHMLTKATIGDVAGINGVEWDAVELPSQFMENWCYDKPTVYGFAKHYETGEPLPEEMFEKLSQQRTFGAGMMACRQLLFGMMDIELHSNYDPNGSETIFDVHRRMAEIYTPYSMPVPEDRFLCGFGHIFAGGYSARYYSYMWAEVMSADAFGAFEDVGLDNEQGVREVGMKFRDTVLSLGGGVAPMDVFKRFRGREPKPDALLRHKGLA